MDTRPKLRNENEKENRGGDAAMKIIKRNGSEETFDRQKIKNAIEKANN